MTRIGHNSDPAEGERLRHLRPLALSTIGPGHDPSDPGVLANFDVCEPDCIAKELFVAHYEKEPKMWCTDTNPPLQEKRYYVTFECTNCGAQKTMYRIDLTGCAQCRCHTPGQFMKARRSIKY